MLRAYDYVESVTDRAAIQSTERFSQELKLMKDAVDRMLHLESNASYHCPGCHGTEFVPFFTKWNAEYFRCTECGSVFTPVDRRTLDAYQSDTGLRDFRGSAEYQQDAVEKRALSWHELRDWISFRSYRYLGRNQGLHIVSGRGRYSGLVDLIKQSRLCGSYFEIDYLRDSNRADIGLSFNLIQQMDKPMEHLTGMNQSLKMGGLLFLSARIGTGFDILVLRDHAHIYPYEHVSLLSKQGIENVLRETGFELLDYSTPGSMDVGYVQSNYAFIPPNELFIKNLIHSSDQLILGEFQRFLQKSGMSSYAHIVAKKVEER